MGAGAREEEPARPLVGRRRELEALRPLVARGAVLSILGPPGVGKTRLARALATPAETPDHEHVFCELLEASSLEEMCALVARASGVDVAGCATAEEAARTIGRALTAREGLLLVLDNFEALTPHAQVVAQWAERGAAVVVTSRQPLGLPMETVFTLAPLDVHRPAEESEAVALFMAVLGAGRPDYAPSAPELALAHEIVRSFEGLPLAIVLTAAAATAPLRRADLDAGLGAGVTAAGRTALARAIGASWARLSPVERDVFAQCSVFRGGFDEDAVAATVALGEGAAAGDPVAVVRALAGKSLFFAVAPSSEGGAARYGVLSSIRDFAEGKLADGGGAARAEAAHALHYAALAQRAHGEESHAGAVIRAELTADADNLLVAHRRARARAQEEPALATAAVHLATGLAVGATAFSVGVSKALSWLDASVSVAPDSLEPPVGALAMLTRSRLLDQMGRAAEALASARMAREMADDLPVPDLSLRAWSAEAMGRGLLALGRWREAREGLEAARSAFALLELHESEARTLVAIGDTWFYEDNLPAAESTYARALEQAERAGSRGVLGLGALRVAIVEMELGRSADARARYAQAIEHMRAAGDRSGEASATTYLAILEQDLGLLDIARARFETLAVTAREVGNRRVQGIAALYLGALLVEVRELPDAIATLDLAERVLAEVGVGSAEAYARGWRAAALAMKGEIEPARALLLRVRGALNAMKEQSFYGQAVELFEAHVHLAEAERALEAGDHIAAAARRAEAERRLAAAPQPEQTQSDVRIARRVLSRALGVSRTSRPPPVPVEVAGEPSDRSLVIEESGAWFRPPGAKPVDIAKRAPLRRLLAMLLTARLEQPGQPIVGSHLVLEVWGKGDPAALQNRLRVAIATLRKLGLATYLFTRGGGYLLDPGHPVLRGG